MAILDLGAKGSDQWLTADAEVHARLNAIGDASFSWTGYHWPWPRAYLARIVDRPTQDRASVIRLVGLLLQRDPDPQGDAALASAFAQSGAAVRVANIYRSAQVSGGMKLASETAQMPLEQYQESFARIDITPTLNAAVILRDVQVYDRVGTDTYTDRAFEMASLYQHVSPPSDFPETGLTYNGQRVPLCGRRMLVNYGGPAGQARTAEPRAY